MFIRNTDDLGKFYAGVCGQKRLYLYGGNVLAAYFQHILETAVEGDAVVLVYRAQVARIQPAVLKCLGVFLRGFVIAAEDAVTTDAHFATLPWRKNLICIGVDNLYLYSFKRLSTG